eukprot:8022911-Pyramimonas_sp.AAC.1
MIPEHSMIAGLGGAVGFPRCALHNMLDRVARGTPEAGLTFANGCSDAGLVISCKSTIVTNQADLGGALQKGDAKEGFAVKVGGVAADLGIDRGTVGFRRPKQAQLRRGAQN